VDNIYKILYYQIGAKADGIRREQLTRHRKHGQQNWKDVREKRQGIYKLIILLQFV
jgi:hypothetical protein